MTPFYLPLSVRRALAAILLGSFAFAARAALDAPVSPNALAGVTAELQFFKNLQGRYIVGGQQEIAWSEPRAEEDVNYIIQHTGRTPGLRGFDFLQYVYSPSVRAGQRSVERAIAWAQAGGLVTYCCHMFMDLGSTNGTPQFYTPGSNGNPVGTNFDIRQAVIAGTPENAEYLAKLDIIATELTRLRDAGVVVIWRPFHECGGTWFWWSRYGAEPFKAAWQIMFDRFTTTHHLTNLIWCFNPTDSFSVMTNWYPGDSMVDMISLDVYPNPGSHPTYSGDYQRMRDFTAGRKVVVMSENGTIPDIDALFAEGGSWGYFCTWNGFENDLSRNSAEFLNTVFNHPRVLTRDELPGVFALYARPCVLDPMAAAVTAGANLTLTLSAAASEPSVVDWQRNGLRLATAPTSALTLTNVQSADTGLYVATIAAGSSAPAIVGLSASGKVVGAGSEVGQNILHSNGNIYDQVLATGDAVTVSADPGQVTRTSFLDPDGDIVQVEFSGAGALSIVLDGYVPPALPAKYRQNVAYAQGRAGIVITGADQTTNISVFSVGRITAINPALFRDDVTYDGFADIAFIAIASPTGKSGGIYTGNTRYSAHRGFTGLYAPAVQFLGPVRLHDINAADTATPVLLFGDTGSAIEVTGGDLAQDNHQPILLSGAPAGLRPIPGTDSHGNPVPSNPIYQTTTFQQNGIDVTTQIVVNPTP